MKASALAIGFVFLALSAAAQPSDLHPRTVAAGCTTSALSCDAIENGELAPDDCVFPDGTRYDVWSFAGAAGQRIIATLTPVDSSFAKPRLALIPPSLLPAETMAVLGTAPLSLQSNLPSTGTWKLAVETNNPSDAGRYKLALQCGPGAVVTASQNCLRQALDCGQTYLWSVTPTSCEFFNSPGYRYALFTVSLAQGDRVAFSVHSDAFDPGVAVYFNGGKPQVSNRGKQTTQDAVVEYTAPASNNYEIAAYGSAQSLGEFSITSNCIVRCTPPSITTQPASQSVPLGGSATLTIATAPNTAVVTYAWYDADNGGLPSALGTGPTFKVTNVKTKHRYYAQAQNGCGVATSAIATITPQTSSRLHSIRH